MRKGSKSDRIDARKLSEQLYKNNVKSIYHGEHGLHMMKELARSYLTITKDLTRVMNRRSDSWAECRDPKRTGIEPRGDFFLDIPFYRTSTVTSR